MVHGGLRYDLSALQAGQGVLQQAALYPALVVQVDLAVARLNNVDADGAALNGLRRDQGACQWVAVALVIGGDAGRHFTKLGQAQGGAGHIGYQRLQGGGVEQGVAAEPDRFDFKRGAGGQLGTVGAFDGQAGGTRGRGARGGGLHLLQEGADVRLCTGGLGGQRGEGNGQSERQGRQQRGQGGLVALVFHVQFLIHLLIHSRSPDWPAGACRR